MSIPSVADTLAISDWDDAYANASHIENASDYVSSWQSAAAAFRQQMQSQQRCQLSVAYASHTRARLDVFLPQGSPRGIAVFVHGGYWLRFDRSDWSHLAAGAVTRGYVTVIPGYPLCPEVSIARITDHLRQALCHIATLARGPVLLAGHSAGGHLVSRMQCRDIALPAAVRKRLGRTLSISGVHDLVPLIQTAMNRQLKLDWPMAQAESPARLQPHSDCVELATWVGAAERPEFHRQSALMAALWHSAGVPVVHRVAPDRHHFDVIEALTDSTSDMLDWWLGT